MAILERPGYDERQRALGLLAYAANRSAAGEGEAARALVRRALEHRDRLGAAARAEIDAWLAAHPRDVGTPPQ